MTCSLRGSKLFIILPERKGFFLELIVLIGGGLAALATGIWAGVKLLARWRPAEKPVARGRPARRSDTTDWYSRNNRERDYQEPRPGNFERLPHPSEPKAGPPASLDEFRAEETPALTAQGRVFGRDRISAGKPALVRFVLHLPDQLDDVRAMVLRADPRAEERTSRNFDAKLETGDRVRAQLTVERAKVDEPVQELAWHGRPLDFEFAVTASGAGFGELFARVAVTLNDAPLGALRWYIQEGRPDAPAGEQAERAVLARYRNAFVSYASADRVEVLKRVQGVKATGVDVFMDVLDFEPGDRYRELLETAARGADLFLLFWSRNAASSEWVIREAEWALAQAAMPPEHRPDFRPVIIDGPPPATPPPSLKSSVHMNDLIAYVIAAEAAARARSA